MPAIHQDAVDVAACLLRSPAAELHVQRLDGGRNNRVFHVRHGDGSYLLKVYFADDRGRLDAEYAFATVAWHAGVRAMPEPIDCAPSRNAALYEFVPGTRLKRGEVRWTHVDQAVAFHEAVNHRKVDPRAQGLRVATEGYFSLSAHAGCIRARLDRLSGIASSSREHVDALAFVVDELMPLWVDVLDVARGRARVAGIGWEDVIAPADRCLTASDFGFHNAIMRSNGSLCFHDFEYAGWDDPAKVVCDFFCQPQVPVPAEFASTVRDRIIAHTGIPHVHRVRIALALPMYRVKWASILLNDFLPWGNDRRRFAMAGPEPFAARALRQLNRARASIADIAAHPLITDLTDSTP